MCVNFEGKILKSGAYWAVFVPALDTYTQGKTKTGAFAMIKEAVELSVSRKGFSVDVSPMPGDRFILRSRRAENDKFLIALMLKNQRAKYGLSISEVAQRLGISKNAYAQYEQARSVPSITKVEEFVRAMSSHVHVVLNMIDESLAA